MKVKPYIYYCCIKKHFNEVNFKLTKKRPRKLSNVETKAQGGCYLRDWRETDQRCAGPASIASRGQMAYVTWCSPLNSIICAFRATLLEMSTQGNYSFDPDIKQITLSILVLAILI